MSRGTFVSFWAAWVMLIAAILVGLYFPFGGTPHRHHPNLRQACSPIDTGGGVALCAQPTTFDVALRACMRDRKHPSVGWSGMLECVNAYESARGWK